MILSTVNLIKSKNITNNNITSQSFTDFILGKIREEQDVKDKRQLGPAPFPTKQQKSKKPVSTNIFTCYGYSSYIAERLLLWCYTPSCNFYSCFTSLVD